MQWYGLYRDAVKAKIIEAGDMMIFVIKIEISYQKLVRVKLIK